MDYIQQQQQQQQQSEQQPYSLNARAVGVGACILHGRERKRQSKANERRVLQYNGINNAGSHRPWRSRVRRTSENITHTRVGNDDEHLKHFMSKCVANSSPATHQRNSTAARRNWRRRPQSSCRLDSQCSGDGEEEEEEAEEEEAEEDLEI